MAICGLASSPGYVASFGYVLRRAAGTTSRPPANSLIITPTLARAMDVVITALGQAGVISIFGLGNTNANLDTLAHVSAPGAQSGTSVVDAGHEPRRLRQVQQLRHEDDRRGGARPVHLSTYCRGPTQSSVPAGNSDAARPVHRLKAGGEHLDVPRRRLREREGAPATTTALSLRGPPRSR